MYALIARFINGFKIIKLVKLVKWRHLLEKYKNEGYKKELGEQLGELQRNSCREKKSQMIAFEVMEQQEKGFRLVI